MSGGMVRISLLDSERSMSIVRVQISRGKKARPISRRSNLVAMRARVSGHHIAPRGSVCVCVCVCKCVCVCV